MVHRLRHSSDSVHAVAVTEAAFSDALAVARAKRRLPPPAVRRLIRRQAGVTQQDVAHLLRVSRPTVTRWESGLRSPRGDVLRRYADLLDVLVAEQRST